MIKDNYHVLGLMSGTSLDGIDIVDVHFKKDIKWTYKIINCQTIPYDAHWYSILANLVNKDLEELKKIDVQYTDLLSRTIKNFIREYRVKDLDFISSHGHTALHQPNKHISYQIGNLPSLSSSLGLTVVCDFRSDDVLLGGEGAPLVPIGDELLFTEYDYCINLGGFSNISTSWNGSRIAYDICPLNIVLNHYVRLLNMDYDDGGKVSSSGKIDMHLLDKLNSLVYYQQSFPKSLGLEWVNNHIIPLIDSFKLEVKDILRTVLEHAAYQISNAIQKENLKQTKVLCTGGGAYNSFLIQKIQDKTKAKIVIPDTELIEYKEALVFGLLGLLKIRNEVNCLKSVTGAKMDHSSGKVYKA